MKDEENEKLHQTANQFSKKGDYERSAGILQNLSWSGYVPAMYDLARCYMEGRGIPESAKHAEYWLRLSAWRGNSNSVIGLASLMYDSQRFNNPLRQAEVILDWGVKNKFITGKDRQVGMAIFRTEEKLFQKEVKKNLKTGNFVFDFPASECVS